MNRELLSKYFPLNDVQKEQFAALDALYRDWNSKINVISSTCSWATPSTPSTAALWPCWAVSQLCGLQASSARSCRKTTSRECSSAIRNREIKNRGYFLASAMYSSDWRHISVICCQSLFFNVSFGKSLLPIPTQKAPARNQAVRFSLSGETPPVTMILLQGQGAIVAFTKAGP